MSAPNRWVTLACQVNSQVGAGEECSERPCYGTGHAIFSAAPGFTVVDLVVSRLISLSFVRHRSRNVGGRPVRRGSFAFIEKEA